MNKHLAKALKELNDAHAENVPKADTVMKADNDEEWSGTLRGGGNWKLIKNSTNSYTTNTRIYS